MDLKNRLIRCEKTSSPLAVVTILPITIGPVCWHAIPLFEGFSKPIPLGQPVDHAAIEAHEMTSDAADLRVGNGLDDHAVTRPVVAEPADLVGSRYPGGQAE